MNRELPCVRGRRPPEQVMGRTVLVSRPSWRTPFPRIMERKASDSQRIHASLTSFSCDGWLIRRVVGVKGHAWIPSARKRVEWTNGVEANREVFED